MSPSILERNHVNCIGEQGPVLLYGHGFGCHQGMWSGVTPGFAHSHRQVLMDYVGSGRSDRSAFMPSRYARLDGYARDVLEVCDALGLERGVTFVGHSVGASIGMLAQIARPGLFERLVLVGPSPCFLNHPPHYHGGFEREDLEGLLALMDQNYIGWADHLAPVVSGGSEATSDRLHDSFCSTDPQTARVFARATFFADNRADLPRVSCPSLILQHAHDALVPPEVGDYLHRQLAGSTLRVLEVAGHCAHLSHPELVIAAMRDFLGQPGTDIGT